MDLHAHATEGSVPWWVRGTCTCARACGAHSDACVNAHVIGHVASDAILFASLLHLS